MLREQVRARIKDLAVRAVYRLMRWSDEDLAASAVRPSPEVSPAPDEETEIEAELEAAMARSAAMADAPPSPPVQFQVYADATPNPNAMKFTVSSTILESGSLSVATPEQAEAHPLARRIFEINGVDGIFVVNDFCTVTKTPEASWSELIGPIEDVLIDELSG
jgi:hypothetical protein